MIINHQSRFIFYHVPKAAGVSIRSALLEQPGSRRIRPKHLTPAQFRATWHGLTDWRHYWYFSFCFVRDPWERFGSFHRFLRNRRKHRWITDDLNDFAAELGKRTPRIMKIRAAIRPQSHYARSVSFVGRFERLADDFAQVAERLDLQSVALERINASGAPVRYRDRMNARSEAIIAEYYRDDIERFGYR